MKRYERLWVYAGSSSSHVCFSIFLSSCQQHSRLFQHASQSCMYLGATHASAELKQSARRT